MDRIGVSIDAGSDLEESLRRARLADGLGYDSIWMSQLPHARDTPLVLAAYAQATERIRLATGVLPIYTRHPSAMAQMAATLDELSHGRFVLGLGVSHKITVETMWGLHLEHPVEAMQEYLGIVRSLLREGSASAEGAHFSAQTAYAGPHRADLPVLISALRPRMLELAGELADGVVLWMCSPGYVRDEVMPRVRAGRERAGRPMEGFEVVAAIPVSLTGDPAAAREILRPMVQLYAGLPFYRAMMNASGFEEQLARDQISDEMLAELSGIGDEAAVRGIVDRYREAGCTLPSIGPFNSDFDTMLELFTR